MPTARYNPNGGPITAVALFSDRSIIVAKYELMLCQKNSNATTTLKKGDNLNPENDSADLPLPPSLNDGCCIMLETGFKGHAPEKNYQIRLEVQQDGREIGFHSERGTTNGMGQYSLLYVELASDVDPNSDPA